MSNYLVTGGEGFIGSRIANATNGISFDLKSHLDILNQEKIKIAATHAKGIFHCAAKISVSESVSIPDIYYKTNVEGTRSVLKAAELAGSKIVFSSSAAVYGEAGSIVSEESNKNPKSPYAQNKLDGENILKTSSVPHIALRYFNVYGPGQSAEYAGVITFFILNALKGNDVIIYGDGNQIRDFIFVDDVVTANIAAMNYKNKSFEVFNIAGGVETSIKTLAETIIFLTKSSSKIVYQVPRLGDIVYSQADVSRAKDILQWQAKTSLEEGLQQTIKYYEKTNLLNFA